MSVQREFNRHLFQLLAILLIPNFVFAEDSDAAKSHKYMGVASCASSNCHGSVTPRQISPVLQNEYVTWFKRDKHAQAWKVLLSDESKKMAEHLGIEDASKEKTCLRCHSSSAESGNGVKFRTEDGVGCESCHGAAEHWLPTHTASSNTHADSVARGLVALDQPAVRAAQCLSCHYGDSEHPFTHRLYGAGHPRLSFELDTYSVIQPAHWLLDDDYKQRKGDYLPLKMWLAGQRAAAGHVVNLIERVNNASVSRFPEFAAYTCSSCHHDLTRRDYMHRDYTGHLGEPHLNVVPLRMIALALATVDSGAAEEISGLLDALAVNGERKEIESTLSQLRGSLARAETQSNLEKIGGNAHSLLVALLRHASENPTLYYETAEQIAMGVASAHAQLTSGGPRTKELNQIFIALQLPDKFNSKIFSDACAQYLKTIGQ